MLTVYPASFFKEDNDSYSVIFPDLGYLATCGSTIDEAMSMAVECMAGYIYASMRDGVSVPAPSGINDIDIKKVGTDIYSDSVPIDAFVNLVSVGVDEYARTHFEKSVRKTLTIPAWLNDAALAQGINFSQTLREALIAKVRAR